MRKCPVVLFLFLALPLHAQEAPYPVSETDKIPAAELHARRDKIKQKMGPGTLGVFFTNPEYTRNNDSEFQFRGDSNFLYLTGFEEPEAALILVPGGFEVNGKRVTEVLFVNVSDARSITWEGYRMGPNNAKKLLGIEEALPYTEFERMLQKAAAAANAKKLSTGNVPSDGNGHLATMVSAYKKWKETAGFEMGINARQALGQMRGVKSPAELAILKKVCDISARGHVEAIRSAEPGMREWEISALLSYCFRREGCEYEGYGNICGAGANATILHYMSDRGLMKNGDLMLVDAAGEYHGYSADVTRTFPVNGKFSKEQRAVYDIVLRAQDTCIEMCRAGANFGNISHTASEIISKGLMDLGIIKNANESRRYFMHGLGHGIGLDVHDPMPGTLEPGVVLTIEPGIYIKEGSPCDPKWWNIGVRIEDDIMVTDASPVNLSGACPRNPDEIERLMKEKGLGNIAPRPLLLKR